MTIWFDVDDLVPYFSTNKRPSGIQRLCFQVYQEVWAQAGAGGEIRFCRHDAGYTKLVEIGWPALARMMQQASLAPDPETFFLPAEPHDAATAPSAQAGRATQTSGWLAKAQAALRTLGGLSEPLAPSLPHPFEPAEREAALCDGDMLVTLGSIWDPRFASLLKAARAGAKIRFATMFYDHTPISLPQFADPPLAAVFTDWFHSIVPQADILLTISKASARDLKAAMRLAGHPIPCPVILPMGTTHRPVGISDSPPAAPYVLFVSTMEPRKNHALMLAVWQIMLARMPSAKVPDLVFAGRVIGDAIAGFEASIRHPALREKFRVIIEPDDDHLARLYRDCLFTVYPSFYEGWGLPVTESLSFGKTVAASNRGSLPEAGQDFCIYFDPSNLPQATAVIRGLIEHPERVAALEAAIAARFTPPCWSDTAAVLLAALRRQAMSAPRQNETAS